jgi:predicted HicB family RNase H-like nuclease
MESKEGDDMVVSKKQLGYAKKYLQKFDEIKIRVPEGEKEKIQAYAKANGESVNAYIIRLIAEDMKGE